MLGGSSQNGIKSFIYGAIIMTIVAVFIIQFRPKSGEHTASLSQQCVANVRDRCVDPKEFIAALGLIAPHRADDQRLRAMGIRRHVLDGLVERTLLNQDAKRLGITISDDELNAELVKGRFHVSLPAAHGELGFYLGLGPEMLRLAPVTNAQTKVFDYNVYTRVVKSMTNRSPDQFKQGQREELIAQRMRDLIRARAHVSDTEAFESYVREKSTATLDYVSLHRGYFQERYVKVTPKDAAAWAKEHADELEKKWNERKEAFEPGCRQARHILIKLKSDQDPTGHDREEAQGLIDKALSRIKAGESFSAVASELSEDPGSGARGGELGCFVKGKMVKPFEDATFGLKKPGDISDIVETQFGFHIIQLEQILSDEAKAAEEQAKQILAQDLASTAQVENILAATAKRIREAVQGGKSLQQATDEALAALDAEHGIKPSDKKTGDKKTAEAEKKDKDADKKEAKDEAEASDSAEKADAGRPKVETTEAFTIGERPLQDAATAENVAAVAFKLTKPGEVAPDLVKLQDGYAVVALKEKKSASREEFDKERDEYTARLLEEKGHELLVQYLLRLRELAGIELRVNETWAQEPKQKDE